MAVPESELLPLDLRIEDALKLILSGGMVTPPALKARPSGDGTAPARLPADGGRPQ